MQIHYSSSLTLPLIYRSKMGMLGNALLVILGCNAVSSIRIGAFNVRDFGPTKLQSTVSHSGTNIPVQTVLFEVRIALSRWIILGL